MNLILRVQNQGQKKPSGELNQSVLIVMRVLIKVGIIVASPMKFTQLGILSPVISPISGALVSFTLITYGSRNY